MSDQQTAGLVHVYSVSATAEDEVYSVDCDIVDMAGNHFRCPYIVRPNDDFGIAPEIRVWIAENDPEILSYIPPSQQETRASMPPVTKRQLSLALVRNGYPLALVSQAIASMQEGQAKDEAQIEWEMATSFDRTSPSLRRVAAAIGIDEDQIDTLWAQALLI
ncbi:hypothetical protein ACQZ4Z_13065 [Agrobacterium vitis]|uniref:hypothetical protein n=1 Tax=Agrobacterium vitis TaxID=373 RepID=UPI001572931E|nr:hypothetical protein [Agrobacterium vitis]NSZ42844.1 hypothetical protein [Agrobacterium vitis]